MVVGLEGDKPRLKVAKFRKTTVPSLKQLGMGDPEVRELFKIAHKHSLREKALELVLKKLGS